MIAEEAPLDVLSASGNGVDIYKLTTFTLAGVQELAKKVGDLETRIVDIEARMVAGAAAAGGGASGEASLQSVIDYLVSVGVKFVNGITHIAILVVENFTIGSAEKPNGITLYDEATGEPYCVKMLNGSLTPTLGACSQAQTDAEDTEAPIITINGNNPANINIGGAYSDLGALVTDNVNENLGFKTFLNGVEVAQINIDTASSTTYAIEYKATDQAGNIGTATRTVIVGDGNEGLSLNSEANGGESLVEASAATSTVSVTEETTTATPTPETATNATSTPQT